MSVDYLNGIDMKSVITLNTEQIINDTLEFNFVTTVNDIQVGGLVNGHNLEKEYANTILVKYFFLWLLNDAIIYKLHVFLL